MMHKKRLYFTLALGLMLTASMLLSSCGLFGAAPPDGTEENPIVWVFVPSGDTERVTTGGEEMAALLYEETGLVIDVIVATSNAAAIEAVCSSPPSAHMASLNTFSYIIAADRGCVAAQLVATRYGSPTYSGQIFVHADSGITSLSELDGLTFCRDDETSTSSWIIPSILLAGAGVDPATDLAEIVSAGSHDASVAGVYTGQCDGGASYIDARTRIEEDYPDVMDMVVVIETFDGIPNDGVQYQKDFPQELADQINTALLALAETEAGQDAMDIAYQWGGLETHGDEFYDGFRQFLDANGVEASADW
jgi:phosphonate transport system substrate-binding protein